MSGQIRGQTGAVRFLLDGRLVEAEGLPPTMTVLEYLREVARRTGTKEGCAEGDCGACTVVLGELSPDGTRMRYRAVNSCIRMLPTIDGQELVTVESLQGPEGTLHPVQQAMVDCHASQCGFCTPGFVMSLFALYLQQEAPDREQVLEALAGNLCRCTGYRPIIDAGCKMGQYPEPLHWSRAIARDGPSKATLRELQRERALALPGFLAPRSTDELAAALEAQPDSLVLAGGTDIGLWITKQLRELPPLVYLGEVRELRQIEHDEAGIRIGAAVSLTDAWDALVAAYPSLAEVAQRFGSPPVRNSGTLCGNLANGSPIGDSMPILIALGAELSLRCGDRTRQLPLERFYLGYQRRDLAPGEFVTAVTVPAFPAEQWVACYKVSKRFDQDISALCAAFCVQVRDGTVLAARIAFGGMAGIPARAAAAERALLGARWNAAAIEAAVAALAQDFQPLTDLRASSAYRLQVAGNLLRRFQLEHGAGGAGGADSVAVRTAAAAAV
jgi:xanthine dehydrogenase small subunit